MKPFTKAEYERLAAFRYTLRQFLGFSKSSAEAIGLSPQHYQSLLAIKGFPGRDYVTISELAEQMQIRHHSAVGLVDRMEAQGLVARQVAAEDRRRVYVTLTPHGQSVLEQLVAVHRDELRRIGKPMQEWLLSLAE